MRRHYRIVCVRGHWRSEEALSVYSSNAGEPRPKFLWSPDHLIANSKLTVNSRDRCCHIYI